ncbi:OsmC family protein [Phycicoccus sp. CSK15P-2]|uniref:OsmC family protein n=1 Tax=Phycicoccus sp. CSK15P-2 TaxID=2807627 RepID=UPI001951CCA2|nr:OsmC family protein [Phycicoccus sp. CSK15P-2]MBM6405767.1 OsmC family protein [Phycicoccus sp. CSK15P-2]
MTDQTRPDTGGTGLGRRSITMTRLEKGLYEVRNDRGGTMRLGGGGDTPDFTPVEIFLAAMAGCSATDVDFITSRIAEPETYEVQASGLKAKDDAGNHLDEIEVTFRVRFPDGPDGDRARDRLPRAMAQSHDRLCTVSRTVQRGAPVSMREG